MAITTTGTYTYNLTGAEIITEALRVLGVLEEGGSASATQVSDSLPSFELYIKGLANHGLLLWSIANTGVELVGGQASYELPEYTAPDTEPLYLPLRIHSAHITSLSGDSSLKLLTIEEYDSIPNKTTQGEPTSFFYGYKTGSSSWFNHRVHLWPVPATAGDPDYLVIRFEKPLEDVGDGTKNINVPPEWLETVKYGLATRLAPMYGYPVQERNLLNNEYKELLQNSLDFNVEVGSVYFQPDMN